MVSLVRNCIVPLLISVFFHQFTKQDVLVVIYPSGADRGIIPSLSSSWLLWSCRGRGKETSCLCCVTSSTTKGWWEIWAMTPVWGGWRWASSQRATSELSFKVWVGFTRQRSWGFPGGVKTGGREGHCEPGEQQERELIATKMALEGSQWHCTFSSAAQNHPQSAESEGSVWLELSVCGSSWSQTHGERETAAAHVETSWCIQGPASLFCALIYEWEKRTTFRYETPLNKASWSWLLEGQVTSPDDKPLGNSQGAVSQQTAPKLHVKEFVLYPVAWLLCF